MRDINKIKKQKRIMRHRRVRAGIKGTADKPRLNIFRSNKHIFLQLINDEKGRTIVSASDLSVKGAKKKQGVHKEKEVKTQVAFETGKALAVLAKEKKIKHAVFDRGGYAYHGRVKAAAEGARLGGLKF
ncbi:MAG: 50S ribosomal protein L18 [Candidatus Tagabacteria bacterium CG_4_10_14_0_2_um_filter_40_13]|uniref:Large ribosomal subunit protein uL18 n=3 Tax=Candidatus Tagaibacteriota TaxID=1817918 RepID=A0A2M8G9D3_9BACT|nr:MAG: 50S ribosomal protein L18 [Candidatus Tagabacteria bacterium CG11_big_fil_rev_8_21_14_0_20_41_11]PIU99562.1 MAG: 50S ribosomal protein L18 [Candidatus Tagabacteria bacterium CG03_land_8_20_14_0_80_41_22]PIZ56130.1 MAG: 50S ribosomal protein L18 [Candidatus Tagabacteria bacterium CG_4_10_14_0_2_um_filter_40_13]PJC24998.1 MAG: 50S ribosomal protein L18 [Candidatus Tagabacteria bacterium CG_4_9_14_0_2_um_filter_41_11]PJC70111.1 MAG: 50S ribosomal protein L18 [Candidatus Tagabacteria bacter